MGPTEISSRDIYAFIKFASLTWNGIMTGYQMYTTDKGNYVLKSPAATLRFTIKNEIFYNDMPMAYDHIKATLNRSIIQPFIERYNDGGKRNAMNDFLKSRR